MKEDTSAAAHLIAFAIAGALFISTVGMVLVTTQQTATDDGGTVEAKQQSAANRLADLLVSSPGHGWGEGADALDRLGLGATNGSGLQQDSIDKMRGALFTTDAANGLLDYDEAKASFGLDPDASGDFHVRIYPVGIETLAQTTDLSHIRTAYIGDWVSLATVTFPAAELLPLTLLPDAEKKAQFAAKTNAKYNLTMFSLTLNERRALNEIGVGYDDSVFISTLAPTILVDQPFPLPDIPAMTYLNIPLLDGDLYPDQKSYLEYNLPGRLAEYDLLIIGSGVDQKALTGNTVKSAIADWVDDGGDLVVLGTDDQNYQWLQPLFSVGVKTVNGAPTAPDTSHPLLREPYRLDWTTYETYGKAWDIKTNGGSSGYDAFNHVIVQGGSDLLAISKDGGFGAGRVTLTTFLPREIYADSPEEAAHFMTNVVLYSDRANLYLDYGPDHPDDQPVAVTVRDSWLWDSKLGQVPVRIQVDVWGMT